jgi:septum site-determining protein MinC
MARQYALGGALESPTKMVEGTLRSGQSVRFEGNVVVLGDVNPGAEVTAAGNVIVMGVLRGTVQAGAAGDERAVIVAFRLRPTQLRIADHISRSPDGEVFNPNQPEIARVRDGTVVIETFPPGGERQGKN